MDTNAPTPQAQVVVEHEGHRLTRWEWTDRDDRAARDARLAHRPSGAGVLHIGPGPMEFPVDSIDEARALVADMALAERIEDQGGNVVYQPPRVLLAVGDGVTFPFQAPADWHARIRALAGYVRFGPGYRSVVLEALLAMNAAVRDGWSVGAYDHLVTAERAAGGTR